MNPNKKSLIADLTLLLVAFLWGTTFVASKYLLNYFTPLFIISIRFIIAFVIMSLVFRSHFKSINKYDLKGGIIVGFFLFVGFATQLIALQYTDPGKQAFLAATYVVMVPFIAWALNKKRPDSRSFIGAFICFMGIGMLTLNGSFSMSFGDSLTMFSSVFFAGHIMSTDYFVQKIDPIKLTIVQFGAVAVLSTLLALITEPFPVDVAKSGIYAVLYLGVVCTTVAYFLQTIAQKYTLSTHTAIILSLEAVFGSIISMIVLKELFTMKMIIGCVSILAAILVIELKGSSSSNGNHETKKIS